MPHGVHARRVLPKLVLENTKNLRASSRPLPKLWNAKRKIKTSQGLPKEAYNLLKANPLSKNWRNYVSEDVRQYVDDMEEQGHKFLPEERLRLLRDPARWFSRPQNVPTSLREQVYFPDFTVTLRRNAHLGPYYAQFIVPLFFSKLDLKSYLKELYNVDVLHIRSYVELGAVKREDPSSPYSRGPIYREKNKKRMTVQLVDPFIWPVKPEDVDIEALRPKVFWDMLKANYEAGKKEQDYFGTTVDHTHRVSIAEQAQQLLTGKQKWSPSWKSVPADVRVLQGNVAPPSSSTPSELIRR